jgi:ketosteroid isomerase-like protein
MDEATRHEPAPDPEDLSRFVVERLNAGDVDGLVALYEPDAVMALPGGAATGVQEIRAAYEHFVAGQPGVVRGDQQATLRWGDLALTSSRLPDGTITVEVARQQADGTWLWIIDQPSING